MDDEKYEYNNNNVINLKAENENSIESDEFESINFEDNNTVNLDRFVNIFKE